jgi:prepilin-type N-terminal cleavage/methylation domain-containing protein
MCLLRSNRKGFTLVELLLSTTILASLLFVLSLFFSLVLQARVKQQTIAEVEEQGRAVLRHMAQDARNAESILSPVTSTAGTALSLDMPGTGVGTIIYDAAGGALRVMRGTTSTLQLTNGRVLATDVTFTNLSRTGTRGAVRMEFTLSYAASSTRQEYIYSKRFTGSASIRVR